MKLLRITSNNPQGEFETIFKTDINIKENSKIGLKSATFQTHKEEFVIDGLNNVIQFSFIAGGTIHEVYLTERAYDLNNSSLLFKDITDKLNNNITYQGKTIGTQFLADVDRDGFFSLKYLVSPFVLETQYFKDPNSNITITSTGINQKNLRSASGNTTDDTAIYYSVKPFIKGCGAMRCKITRFNDTGTADNGFYFGLTRTHPSDWTSPTLSDVDKDLFIRITRTAGNGGFYETQYLDEGTPDLDISNVVLAVNDIIEIRRVQGIIQLGVYKLNVFNIILSYNDKDDILYYPYLIFRTGGDDLRIQNLRVQLNPYSFDNVNIPLLNDELNTLSVPSPRPQLKTLNILTFQNLSIMEFLGFDITNGDLSLTQITSEPNFKGTNFFKFSVFNDTYLIVLDNLQLESYDGFDGIRRSILEIIPATDTTGNHRIEYEPSNTNFIDLKLPRKQNLRNIKGRLLKADLTPANISGLLNLAILIKE